jgi:hypothetical protein
MFRSIVLSDTRTMGWGRHGSEDLLQKCRNWRFFFLSFFTQCGKALAKATDAPLARRI